MITAVKGIAIGMGLGLAAFAVPMIILPPILHFLDMWAACWRMP